MTIPPKAALLTVAEMGEAEHKTISAGVPGISLMEKAGRCVARAIQQRYAPMPVTVLCGPGNNGGDGFIVARELSNIGWPVRLGLLGPPSRLAGDAAMAAASWTGAVEPFTCKLLDGASIVVDAVFGTGLSRNLDGAVHEVIEALSLGSARVVAVDVPSGLGGDSGQVHGVVAPADLTVTFFRKKPGHVLLPGRDLCGVVEVVDIGIPDEVLGGISLQQGLNDPVVWLSSLPRTRSSDHKYCRGHGVISGGAELTGATRLASEAARRAGAGLLTVISAGVAAMVYRIALPGCLVFDCETPEHFAELISDTRRNALLLGPGHGVDARTRSFVEVALATGRPVVLDADALTVYESSDCSLAESVKGPLVITPHEGEFAKLFPDLGGLSKIDRTRAAAARLGGVVVLKGADTVIADPSGTALVNDNAPPWLATGGTGDVLAGTILGLLAQGMSAFEAAAAAVWINGDAARRAGEGLVAEDLAVYLSRSLVTVRNSASPSQQRFDDIVL